MPSTEFRHIEGVEKVRENMRKLPVNVQQKLMKPAVAASANVVTKAQANLAPTYHGRVADGHPPPGTLKKAIQRKLLGQEGTRTQYISFVRYGKSRQAVKQRSAMHGPLQPGAKRGSVLSVQNLDAFYWRWVEFGSRNNKAAAFMRNGLKLSASAAIDAMYKSLSRGLARILPRR